MKSVKRAAWLGLLILLAACDAPDDQVCQRAQYDAIQSLGPAFYNLGTALHR